jgi:hypothetical protein
VSGLLRHSPALVIRQALVDLGLSTDPEFGNDWPAFATKEPDRPDSVITCYDTAGRDLGRTVPDQGRTELHGVQVRVRSGAFAAGWAKANALALALDGLYRLTVVVDGTPYLVRHVARTTGVLSLGLDSPTTARRLFTVNALASITAL